MILTLNQERFTFDLPDALELYKFDEPDRLSPYFHGAPMKCVDVMAVFKKYQLWIEIKEYSPEEIDDIRNHKTEVGYDPYKWLLNNLKHKFRDTYLYRHCEGVNNLPIVYICLTNFDDALNQVFKKQLKKYIPAGKPNPRRWTESMIEENHVLVVNEASWKRNLEGRFGTCTSF